MPFLNSPHFSSNSKPHESIDYNKNTFLKLNYKSIVLRQDFLYFSSNLTTKSIIMKHLVVLTGAGISAESGIKTFREMGGLWEEYDITEVASPEGWDKNPQLVLDFYNQRRKELYEKEPNKAHFLLKELESDFKVSIITQNVDDLHERAGSTNVLHLSPL